MTTFETNGSYKMRFITDSNLVIIFKVVKRTAKTVTVQNTNTGEKYTAKIRVYDNSEYVLPYGTYSMAPSIKASRKV